MLFAWFRASAQCWGFKLVAYPSPAGFTSNPKINSTTSKGAWKRAAPNWVSARQEQLEADIRRIGGVPSRDKW